MVTVADDSLAAEKQGTVKSGNEPSIPVFSRRDRPRSITRGRLTIIHGPTASHVHSELLLSLLFAKISCLPSQRKCDQPRRWVSCLVPQWSQPFRCRWMLLEMLLDWDHLGRFPAENLLRRRHIPGERGTWMEMIGEATTVDNVKVCVVVLTVGRRQFLVFGTTLSMQPSWSVYGSGDRTGSHFLPLRENA